MTIKAYGTIESITHTTAQQTKQGEKPQETQINTLKTHAILFAEFRVESQKISIADFSLQNGIASLPGASKVIDDLGFDLSSLEFNGRSILDFSQEEAMEMVSDDGYFGVANTAGRLADFVISGGGDNIDRLRAGREGILRGFKEAEEIWGGTLPEISYKTLDTALAKIDARIQELGGQVVDATV